ncbi:MAG: CapA family protein [Actinomycetota bacterium]|nr:CapA family protein [Actinomycetota bacterium]
MNSAAVNLLLAGDVMTGRGIDQILRHPSEPVLHESWAKSAMDYVELAERRNGPIPRSVGDEYIWGDALDTLGRSDLAARIVNLETAVTVNDMPWVGKGINYRMHPANVERTVAGRADCCVLANNHVLDWGYSGLEETVASLQDSGLRPVGAGHDALAAARPVRIQRAPGRAVVVVALGTISSGIPASWAAREDRPGVALARSLGSAEIDAVAASVATVARANDVVVASIHWGGNWGYVIPKAHRRFARALIAEAGVHVVHGHSSHHPLGMEVYRGRLILYGCGDLINDYEGIQGHEQFQPDLGLLYLATIDPKGALEHLELIPLRRRLFRLQAASSEERSWLQQRLTEHGRSLGTRVNVSREGNLALDW